MGGCKERLLDSLFQRRRNDNLTRFKDDRGYDDYVGAATQAIVT